MKRYIKYLGILFITLFTFNTAKADDCLRDYLRTALVKSHSKEVVKLFDDDGANAFEAWKVLYLAGDDTKLSVSILTTISDKIVKEGQKSADLVQEIKTAGNFAEWKRLKLANRRGDLLTTLKSNLSNLPTNLLNKIDNWSIDELTRLESHLNKYSDLAGELSNPKLFDAVETIMKNPENAWDALRDLKSTDIVSESVNRIGKSSFFTDVIGKGRAFEKNVLLDIIHGFKTKSGKAYDAVKSSMESLNKNIDDYVLFNQVQFDVPGGKMIADQVLVKYKVVGNKKIIDDVVILENKLKSTTNYTSRQISGWRQVYAQNKLTIRSVKAKAYANGTSQFKLTQNTDLKISNVIRIDGGSTGQFNSVRAIVEDLSKF